MAGAWLTFEQANNEETLDIEALRDSYGIGGVEPGGQHRPNSSGGSDNETRKREKVCTGAGIYAGRHYRATKQRR